MCRCHCLFYLNVSASYIFAFFLPVTFFLLFAAYHRHALALLLICYVLYLRHRTEQEFVIERICAMRTPRQRQVRAAREPTAMRRGACGACHACVCKDSPQRLPRKSMRVRECKESLELLQRSTSASFTPRKEL